MMCLDNAVYCDAFSNNICIVLGVRSLANASGARQFNPLNPPGVGWVPLPQTNMAAVVGRARSVMRGRARSCVCGRACVVGHSLSCVVVRGRARSVVRGRACAVVRAWSVIRGHSCVVVRGRSCVVVLDRMIEIIMCPHNAVYCDTFSNNIRMVIVPLLNNVCIKRGMENDVMFGGMSIKRR